MVHLGAAPGCDVARRPLVAQTIRAAFGVHAHDIHARRVFGRFVRRQLEQLTGAREACGWTYAVLQQGGAVAVVSVDARSGTPPHEAHALPAWCV